MVSQLKAKGLIGLTSILVLALIQPSVAATDLTELFQPAIRGSQSDESVYFVMTDRFNNANIDNDNGGVSEGRFSSGYVPDEIGWWHGGDFKGITERIPYIQKMGYTSIWITPPVKQITFQGSSSSYHGYWGLDFMTVDPHLGTEAEFKELVKTAHEAGLKVIVDVVANHTADVIQFKANATEYLESNKFPYKDALGKKFIPSVYAGKVNFPKLSSTKSFPYVPILDKSNAKVKNPNWLNDVTNYHNRGNSSFTGESSLDGDFFGLDDLFTEKPNVVKGWTDVWSYWINEFDIDGMRIDTFKHVNPEFWKAVIPKVLEVAKKKGKNDFPIFGEVADSDSFSLASYLRSGQTPSVLDFAFQKQVANYLRFGTSTDGLVSLFNADDLYTTSATNAYQLATFLGNHDMGRIGLQLSKAVGENQDAVLLDRALLSNAMLFLLRGGPITYYGDEVGMIGTGGDKESRQDMFPTQVIDWQNEARIGSQPIGTKSSFDLANPLRTQISTLQSLIKENPALRNGVQQIRYSENGVFAVTRYAAGREYLVVFNSSDQARSAKISFDSRSTQWRSVLGDCIFAPGTTLEIKARSYCVIKGEFESGSVGSQPVALLKPIETAITGDLVQLSARVAGGDYTEVSFSVKAPGKSWLHVGTSDRRTYADSKTSGGLHRVFINPRSFKSGATVEVIAVSRSANGEKRVSEIIKYKIKY